MTPQETHLTAWVATNTHLDRERLTINIEPDKRRVWVYHVGAISTDERRNVASTLGLWAQQHNEPWHVGISQRPELNWEDTP